MGIWQFKTELEDTAFMYLYPEEYKCLNRKLRRHRIKYGKTLDKSKAMLKKTLEADPTLKEQATQIKVYGRTKELYSLWHKMKDSPEASLEQINDIIALRVVVSPKVDKSKKQDDIDRGIALCYHILGVVQHVPGFQPVPTKVKDYISFPKPNGYRSLHTALMLNGQNVEVQIRTSAMHQVAEYGMASHWAYTDAKKRGINRDELYNTPWLSSIKEWQEDFICSRDFVDCVRRELLGKRVFVFLRNGKILNLSRGATVIDAAFQIHTEVGFNMHGVEINGKPESFSYVLKNGDVVSILTGVGKPSIDWMRFAKIRSTRSKLRSYFRLKQRESLREAGKILLVDFLDIHSDLLKEKSYVSGNIPDMIEQVAQMLPGKTRFNDLDELLVDLGGGHDRAYVRSIASKLFLVPLADIASAELRKPSIKFSQVAKNNSVEAIIEDSRVANETTITGSDDAANFPPTKTSKSEEDEKIVMDLFKNQNSFEFADKNHLCRDCLPVMGDEIVGTKMINLDNSGNSDQDFVTMVHRVGCAQSLKALDNTRKNNKESMSASLSSTEHLIRLRCPDEESAAGEKRSTLAEVVVTSEDRKLLLSDCSIICSEIVDIVKSVSLTTDEHATLEFLVKVENLEHLERLMDSLRAVASVISVERRYGAELL